MPAAHAIFIVDNFLATLSERTSKEMFDDDVNRNVYKMFLSQEFADETL